MAHGAHQVVLGIVEQPEPGDVLQQDGRAAETGERIAHREDARKVVPIFVPLAQRDDVIVASRQVVLARYENLVQRLAQRRGQPGDELGRARQRFRRGVFQLDRAGPGNHENRIG